MLRIFHLLDKSKSPIMDGFVLYQLDLKKKFIEARDNVKFLMTIMRHMDIITNCNDFDKITECLPDLMERLQLIWILSRYYSTDEVMVPFMERIIWCLREKVKRELNNEFLFR